MFKYRDYQYHIIERGREILHQHKFLYLSMEVRTGKTLTALGIMNTAGVKQGLFITKKKAISSIEDDYKMLSPVYELDVINYESVHKLPNKRYQFIVFDEAHSMGAFPKPSKRAKQAKELILKNNPLVILLSGTPTPESYSQMYHQVYGIPNNPFKEFRNFYRFCDVHVTVKSMMINGLRMNDYKGGRESIIQAMNPFTISYTQKEAGFKSSIDEEILYVPMKESTYELIKRLQKDLVIEGKEEVILADTPVKLMMKTHQLCSGTIKFESGNSMTLDSSKAEFIKEKFKGVKIGIFYKFIAELKLLKEVFGDNLTTEIDEFNNTDKSIALQIVSGREGISLRHAKYLVYYNIDFSATSYWQSRDRMTTKDRSFNKVYWIFSKGGIEKAIYKAVSNKKDYTLRHFRKDLLTNNI